MKTSYLRGLQFHDLKKLEKELFNELRNTDETHLHAVQRDIAWVQKCIQEKINPTDSPEMDNILSGTVFNFCGKNGMQALD